MVYPVLSCYKSGLFLLWPANYIPLNSAWGSSHSQKPPWLFDLNLVANTETGALGTILFKNTQMVSNVNVNFFAQHWKVSLKTPSNHFQRDYTDELAFLQSEIASEYTSTVMVLFAGIYPPLSND